jgi:hypothetical protein
MHHYFLVKRPAATSRGAVHRVAERKHDPSKISEAVTDDSVRCFVERGHDPRDRVGSAHRLPVSKLPIQPGEQWVNAM